ncbi:MAG: LysR substrate-binding domain-containing protein, partial [Lacunisphaera sp.]
YHDLLDALFAGTKKQPRIVEEHEGGGGLVTAVEAGTGLAFVAESLACSIGPRLKLISLTPAPASIIIGAAWPRDRVTPAAQQFFRCAQRVKGGAGK